MLGSACYTVITDPCMEKEQTFAGRSKRVRCLTLNSSPAEWGPKENKDSMRAFQLSEFCHKHFWFSQNTLRRKRDSWFISNHQMRKLSLRQVSWLAGGSAASNRWSQKSSQASWLQFYAFDNALCEVCGNRGSRKNCYCWVQGGGTDRRKEMGLKWETQPPGETRKEQQLCKE